MGKFKVSLAVAGIGFIGIIIGAIISPVLSTFGTNITNKLSEARKQSDADKNRLREFQSLVNAMRSSLSRADKKQLRQEAVEFRDRMDRNLYDDVLKLDAPLDQDGDFRAVVTITSREVNHYLEAVDRQEQNEKAWEKEVEPFKVHKPGCPYYTPFYPWIWDAEIPLSDAIDALATRLETRKIYGKN